MSAPGSPARARNGAGRRGATGCRTAAGTRPRTPTTPIASWPSPGIRNPATPSACSPVRPGAAARRTCAGHGGTRRPDGR
ncbi:Hypothetical protein SCLAV_5365 [Streptomyces clavuligerus]|uniref:Uncharacterized protein n=1 Tax=Streptomyces clavuligerus TaxID=1901 RepID=E2Q089_STRCL|nr:Hypothetical protein SCLAV_5365 [Streptomyces clavuligerus]